MIKFEDEHFILPTLRGEVDALFRQTLRRFPGGTVSVELWNPQVDVTEEDDRIVLEVDLPGVRREDVSLEVQGHVLVIAGHRNIVRHRVGERYSHCERVSGSFRRRVPLPQAVEEEKITATLQEGILRVELPKRGDR